MHHWPVAAGVSSAPGRTAVWPLVVLGHKARMHFFPDRADPIGQHLLLIGTAPFEVIGVMTGRGKVGQDYDDMVFIPYRAGRARVCR